MYSMIKYERSAHMTNGNYELWLLEAFSLLPLISFCLEKLFHKEKRPTLNRDKQVSNS